MKLTGDELRKKWMNFFEKRGHKPISSASLIPENDPTVLFTTAGMHPLVPYLLGQPHPAGKRLCDAQKCVRTGDIDEVGDAAHCTFFEMLGNWSLGDYFKKEMVAWSYEFLTKELGIPSDRLAVTVFEGDGDCRATMRQPNCGKNAALSKRIFIISARNTTGGDLRGRPVRADRIRRCSSIRANPSAEKNVRPPATAVSMSRCGTTCLCSSIRTPTARSVRSRKRMSTRVWDWNARL